jgi:hypothetical protein
VSRGAEIAGGPTVQSATITIRMPGLRDRLGSGVRPDDRIRRSADQQPTTASATMR